MAAPATSQPSRIASLWLCQILALQSLTVAAQAAPRWEPVNKEELAEQKPKVEADADAEIIVADINFDFSPFNADENTYYYRIKIYTQRGVNELSKINLPIGQRSELSYIYARTIKPDGTIVELDPKDIYDREIIKEGGITKKVKSFAPPGLEPGAIVEYGYTEINRAYASVAQLNFQFGFPARLVKYRHKIFDRRGYDICALSINCPNQPLKLSSSGECSFQMANLKGVKDEPFQPPQLNRHSTILVFHRWARSSDVPAVFWGEFSKKEYDEIDHRAKPNKAVSTSLTTIVAPGDTDTQKLKKIYDYCRTKIVCRENDASGLSSRERKKLKENETAADVLKAGSGSHDDINRLFAALVRAAGMESQFVHCNDRSSVNFDAKLIIGSFMVDDVVVAVRTGNSWQYFDPGSLYLPFGMLSWKNCDTMVLHCDSSGKAQPIPVKGHPAEASQTIRKARLQLNAEGTLEGEVTETYTGYQDAQLKNQLDEKTPSEREKDIREGVQRNLPLAELTQLVIENAASPTDPIKITYHLRVPEYASRTDSRLFVQPAVFQKGAKPWFESETRQNTIMFNHRFTTQDDIVITPPPGHELEEASAPGGIDMGELGEYNASIAVGRETGAIAYKRTFKLSGLTFAKKYYPRIKPLFDEIVTKDAHTIILKRIEPAATAPTPVDVGNNPVTTPNTDR